MSRRSRKRGSGRHRTAERRRRQASNTSSKKIPAAGVLLSGPKSSKTRTMSGADFRVSTEILKIDEGLGLVFGWAIVSNIEGEPYFDLQGDHIPEETMLEATTDFMLHSRIASEMHKVEERGSVVFAWPMTKEIAVAFGIITKQTGLMIAMKPDSDMLQKFKDGELTGFSIGGLRGEDEEVDDV